MENTSLQVENIPCSAETLKMALEYRHVNVELIAEEFDVSNESLRFIFVDVLGLKRILAPLIRIKLNFIEKLYYDSCLLTYLIVRAVTGGERILQKLTQLQNNS